MRSKNNNKLIILFIFINLLYGCSLPTNQEILEAGANNGEVSAQFYLGKYFYEIRKYDEAFKWWYKLAEQGVPQGQNNIGLMYQYGLGVTKDEKEAIKWFEKANKQGFKLAKENLTKLQEQLTRLGYDSSNSYMPTKTTKTDPDNILERAQRGDILSQMTLAWRYENGKEGVSRDKQTAIYWYQQAANRGNFEAKEALTRLNSTSSSYQPTQATPNDSGKPNKPTRKLNTKMYTGVFTE